MIKEKIKAVAGHYFKSIIGAEPDTLKAVFGESEPFEYTLEATFGERKFEIWMCPMHNLIELNEVRRGTFAEAAALAGMDRNLNTLNA